MIPALRPDLILIDKTINKVSLIDVAVPWDSRAEQKEQEKKYKYQDLRTELRRLTIARCDRAFTLALTRRQS